MISEENVKKLIEISNDFIEHKEEGIWSSISEAEKLVKDIEHTPHAFVLAALMDRQINADKAWTIPYKIKEHFGTFDINELYKHSLDEYIDIFEKKKLHRYNEKMAEVFYKGVKRIVDKYDGDVSIIWSNKPKSGKVVTEFLQFDGVGPKIATMMANLLMRNLHVEFSDKNSVGISPDTHVKRIMYRMGIINIPYKEVSAEYVMEKAREMYPSYPGIFDGLFWDIGRHECDALKPQCDKCRLKDICEKHLD